VSLGPQREPLPTRIDDTPVLPEAYDRALEGGLDRLGLSLAPGVRVAIDGHVRLLVAWNAAINLTAIRDPAALATLHVVDSLTALGALRARGARRLLDLGSGAGFPGFPLAVALDAEEAVLLDSVAKKVRFIAATVEATGESGRVAAEVGRAEGLAGDDSQRELWPVVTARAVGGLADLIELSFPLLEPGGILVAWKRADPGGERAAAGRAIVALGGGSIDAIDASLGGLLPGHRLIVASKQGRTPSVYPRDPAVRKRRPW
jgi:16S rRNA (guanine527-N7)-methyltransferase